MIPLNRVSLIRLEKWCSMEDWGDYLDRCEGLNYKNVSKEGSDFFTQKYNARLKRRITYCENIEPKDEFIFYTLAELYERIDVDGPIENRYKRKARYYAIRSVRKNRRYSRAWALLADLYSWVSLLGNDEKGKDRAINFAGKSITCIKKAIKYDSENKKYREDLKGYYHWRNETYNSLI